MGVQIANINLVLLFTNGIVKWGKGFFFLSILPRYTYIYININQCLSTTRASGGTVEMVGRRSSERCGVVLLFVDCILYKRSAGIESKSAVDIFFQCQCNTAFPSDISYLSLLVDIIVLLVFFSFSSYISM